MTSWLSTSFISHPAIQALGWALVHFIWQGLAIAAVCGLLLVILRRHPPAWRYAVGCLGLGLMACAPVATFSWLLTRPAIDEITTRSLDRASIAKGADLRGGAATTEHLAIVPEVLAPRSLAAANHAEPAPSGQPGTGLTASSATSAWNRWDLAGWRLRMEPYLPACVVVWLCGVFALSIRLAGGLRRIGQWRSDATPLTEPALLELVRSLAARMGLNHSANVRLSQRISVPAVVGWLRPVILVPASMLSGLTPAEWESIFAHELAHIRRHDYLVNILQTVVETVLFYHPAVWWLSGRIRAEREHCCDDLAVATCGNRLAFARALARMEELRCGDERLALAANGGSLLRRIRRLAANDSAERPARAAVGTALAAGTLLLAGAWWALAASQASGSDSIDNAQSPRPQSAASLRQESEEWPAADAPFEKRKYEVQRNNSKTGVERGVFSGIRLRSVAGKSARIASLDMMYSNLMPYSFIPARVAAELQATPLGEIEFGDKPPPKPQPFQAQWVVLPEIQGGKAPPSLPLPPPSGLETSPKTVTVDQVTEPIADGVQIVPYNDDPIWVPEHLAFYGVNPTGQHRFQVVRIDGVDLGVGPRFGPINALVLADENSDYGVLGSDWVIRVRGDRGEGLWFYAAEGAFYFMAEGGEGSEEKNGRNGSNASDEKVVVRDEKGSGLPAGVPTPSVPEHAGAMTTTRSGHDPEPGRIDQPGVRVLASHTYTLNRRQSTGWVTLRGAEVPIDEGVQHDKWIVYNTLFSDIVAVDATTKQALWSLDWNKREPTWQTLSVVAVDWSPEIAVELFATDGRARELIYRYVKLSDGTPLPRPDDWRPLSQEPATPLLPPIVVVERDGERVTRAAAQSIPGGRSPGEMIEHLLAARPDGRFETGGSITNMETIVSAEKPNYLLGDAMDAAEVRFNLPEGAGLRAEFSGEKVEIEPDQERVTVTITNGKLELIDAGGVVRATASPDGGAEQLVVDCRMESGEVTMVLRTQRIEPSPEYPHPPVQVRMNVDTGAPEDEGDPPHGAIRYEIQPAPTDMPQPVRLKMKWWYDLRRLQEEAQREHDSGSLRRLPQSQASIDETPDLVTAARKLGNWVAAPEIRFDSNAYLQLARALMQLEEGPRIDLLRTMAEQGLDGQLLALCRILFEPRDVGATLRAPQMGRPRYVSYDENEGDFPDSPLAFVGDFPVRVVQRYDAGDAVEAAGDYLEYCLQHGRWTNRSLAWDGDELVAAHRAIHHAAWWGERLDVDEWVEIAWLRNQLEPTVLIWVQAMEHVVGEFPSRSLNREFPIEPATVVAELQRQGYPPEAQLLFVASNRAQPEWIVSLLQPLSAAGYRKAEFVYWQQSPDPVDMPNFRKLLSASTDGWGPQPPDSPLRLRLTTIDPRPKVGEPLRLKLEIKNDGDQVQRYDPQNYAPFRVLKVTRPDGQPDQFIGLTPQTSGGPVELKPGETQVLWESVDATELYLLDEGKYRIQVVAPQRLAGTLPESNSVDVELRAGEQRPLKRLVRELTKDLPEQWRAHQVFDALALSFTPTNLKRDAAEIQIWFTPIPRDSNETLGSGDQQRAVTTLGYCDLGWAHVAADQRAGAVWPQHLDFVRDAFAKARIEVRRDGPTSLEDPPDAQALNDTPWTVTGTVTDGSGQPLAGVEVIAHCGMGTLRQTGSTRTAADGNYELKFGPGILLTDRHSLQMATISARLAGHFEKNLGRQGDLMAAFAEPQGEIGRGEKNHQNLVLPDRPKTVDFVFLPATRLRGMVIDANGRRPEGVRVSLTGPELPPSSSVIAQVRTNAKGEFEIDNIPTGYKFQLLVEPAKAEPPWLAWASPLIEFTAGESSDTHLQYAVDGKPVDFSCQHCHLILQGEGVNWKTALAAAADRPLELKWDGLSTDKVVRAGMAFLELK